MRSALLSTLGTPVHGSGVIEPPPSGFGVCRPWPTVQLLAE
jgi:hypothetical protein